MFVFSIIFRLKTVSNIFGIFRASRKHQKTVTLVHFFLYRNKGMCKLRKVKLNSKWEISSYESLRNTRGYIHRKMDRQVWLNERSNDKIMVLRISDSHCWEKLLQSLKSMQEKNEILHFMYGFFSPVHRRNEF